MEEFFYSEQRLYSFVIHDNLGCVAFFFPDGSIFLLSEEFAVVYSEGRWSSFDQVRQSKYNTRARPCGNRDDDVVKTYIPCSSSISLYGRIRAFRTRVQ